MNVDHEHETGWEGLEASKTALLNERQEKEESENLLSTFEKSRLKRKKDRFDDLLEDDLPSRESSDV